MCYSNQNVHHLWTHLFYLCVSQSKISHSIIGKHLNTLLSDQKVPILFTTISRPVLVTFSLQKGK